MRLYTSLLLDLLPDNAQSPLMGVAFVLLPLLVKRLLRLRNEHTGHTSNRVMLTSVVHDTAWRRSC